MSHSIVEDEREGLDCVDGEQVQQELQPWLSMFFGPALSSRTSLSKSRRCVLYVSRQERAS